MSLRDYDKWTPRERRERAIAVAEMVGKRIIPPRFIGTEHPEYFANYCPICHETFKGLDALAEHRQKYHAEAVAEPESPPTQPEGAPLPVPEQNCRQLAYTGCQVTTGGCR